MSGNLLTILLAILLGYTLLLRRQRKRLEAKGRKDAVELEERHEVFRTLFENAAVAVMVHDQYTGEVLAANQRALATYGARDIPALNKHAFESKKAWVGPPYTLSDMRHTFARVRELGPLRLEWRARKTDGQGIWEDVFLQSVTLEGEPRIVSTSVDISAQKRLQARERHRTNILTALARGESLEKILSRVVIAMEQDNPDIAVAIFICDENREKLIPMAAPHVPLTLLAAIGRHETQHHPCWKGIMATQQDPVILTGLANNPAWQMLEAVTPAEFQCCYALSIRATDGAAIGLSMVFHKLPRGPSEDDLERLRDAIPVCGLAIERKQTEDHLRQRSALEEILRSISTEFMDLKAPQVKTGIHHALERLGDFLEADRAYIFELNHREQTISNTHEWQAPDVLPQQDELQNIALPDLAPTLERLAQHKALIIHRGTMHEHSAVEQKIMIEGDIQSMLAVPMFQDGHLHGFLGFDNVHRDRSWSGIDLNLLKVAANLIGSALLRKQLEQALEHEASYDKLTGLRNRRKFEDLLGVEMRRAERYQKLFSLLLLDIDHFKSVNDTYGHDVGDEVLRKLADMIRRQCRESDIAARWGGEEFVILLPETDEEGARLLAESLKNHTRFIHSAPGETVTISIGATQYQGGDTSFSLFKRADQALYKAKNLGRNRVELL